MASLDQTIKIILKTVDETGSGFTSASKKIDEFTDKVGSITGPLASVTDSIIKADLAAAAIAVTFGTIAVRETIKFQDSLYTVHKFLDADFDTGKARKDIQDLALAFGVSANAVAESTAGFLGASYSYDTALSLVRTSLELAIAGEMDAAAATEILNASMAGFRIPADRAAEGAQQVGDILNKLTDISSSRFMEPIAQGFARVSPLAKGAGLSMEETGAIVTRLVDVFRNGEIAGTALGSGLGSLAKPSGDAAAILEQIGVVTKDSNGEFLSSGVILKDLAGKWGTVAESQKEAALQAIFGKEQAAKFSVVLNDWGKIQEYLTKVTDETTGAVGSMAKEVEGKMALISTSVAKSSEAWRQFIENVGAQIVDDGSLQGLMNNVGELGLAFKKVVESGGLEPLVNALQKQFATLSDAVAKMAANLPEAFEGVDWSGLLDALEDLRGEFGGMFEGVDLTTVEGLRKAIQAIVNTGETLIRVTGGIVDGLTPFVRGLAAVVEKVNESDEGAKEWAGTILGWAKGINTILPSLAALGEGIGAVGTGLTALAASNVVTKLLGMAGGMDTVTAGATKAAAATTGLAGKAGIAGLSVAAAFGTVEIIDLANNLVKLPGALLDLNQSANGAVNSQTRLNDALGKVSAETGVSVTSMRELEAAIANGEITFDEATGTYQNTSEAIDGIAQASDSAAPSMQLMTREQINAALAAEDGGAALLALGSATAKAGDNSEKLTTATGRVVNILRDANGNIVGYGDGLTGIAAKAKTVAEKTDEATKKTDDFLIKMEEIASNERIKNIDAKVSLDIATMETDAERVKAAFDSIDTSITSTGDLLGSLFGSLIDADSLSDKWAIEEQIEKENELRKQSFDLQKQLAEAEIARIEAQIRAMERGDAAIQIDGTGLEPELEAFMWRILEKIRVRANAEFQDYLLGAAA